MKKLFYFLLVSIVAVGFSGCNDDEEQASLPPVVTNPAAVAAVAGTDVTISFNYTAEAGFASSGVTASGGSAVVATDGTAGDVSGTITVTFSAGGAGAGAVVLTVTDADGNSDDATAVITITALDGVAVSSDVSITSVTTGEDISLEFDFLAPAGFASSAVTANGGTATIATDGAADATSGTITVTFSAGAVGAGSVSLTVTDNDGNTDDATITVGISEVPTSPEVSVRGELTGTVNWTNDNIYILETRVTVVDGATLNIEAGTVIKGASGQGAASTALLVARGGTLNANGTAAAPIILTSVLDEITPEMVAAGNFQSPNLQPTQAGLWGGVIILGNAPISVTNEDELAGISNSESQIEGIPVTDENGRYGGNDAADNSGTITYISIRHGGTNIGAGNEINGLTLGGVGSGTTINWVEVVANDDDGIEWFGGTVNVNGALVWNSNDDALDTDQDWIGTCNNFIIVAPNGGSAFELDGPEGATASGMANTFTNGIVYAGNTIDHLVDWDGGTNTGITNVYFYGWDAAYGFIEDEDPDRDGNQNFNPIESFGGDGVGTTDNWEYTLTDGGADAAEIFNGVTAGVASPVGLNMNTVGVTDVAGFSWTWASQSGGLAGVGIE